MVTILFFLPVEDLSCFISCGKATTVVLLMIIPASVRLNSFSFIFVIFLSVFVPRTRPYSVYLLVSVLLLFASNYNVPLWKLMDTQDEDGPWWSPYGHISNDRDMKTVFGFVPWNFVRCELILQMLARCIRAFLPLGALHRPAGRKGSTNL